MHRWDWLSANSEQVKILIAFGAVCVTLGGALVTLLNYLNTRRQRDDSLRNELREVHRSFWDDPAMVHMRHWLANAESYAHVSQVLSVRRSIAEGKASALALPRRDYWMLDIIDRFCNLMTRVPVLDPRFDDHFEVWHRLFVVYWVEQIFEPGHEELAWYVRRFYFDLVDAWERSPRPSTRQSTKKRRRFFLNR